MFKSLDYKDNLIHNYVASFFYKLISVVPNYQLVNQSNIDGDTENA